MLLQEYLCETHQYATPEQWGVVRGSLPQGWVEQALRVSGVATLRKRRLPMEQVVWLVLGIALLRDRSILHVAEALEVALPAHGQDSVPHQEKCRSDLTERHWPEGGFFFPIHRKLNAAADLP